jgi:hypothetical protein
MKHLPLYSLLALFALFSNAQAATIYDIQTGVSVYANTVTGHTGKYYYDQTYPVDLSSPITGNKIASAVTGGDLTSYAWSADSQMADGAKNAYIDLSFGSNVNIYNDDGADLVLFFAGTGTKFKNGDIKPFQFSIDVGGVSLKDNGLMGVTSTTSVYNENDGIIGNEFFASYAMIDLDAFDFDQTIPLGDIRVYLGDSSMPALAALGAYHVTAVPLPLSSVLFGSGLALLSLFRRKKPN